VASPAPVPPSVSRILLIRLSALGDVIRALPLLPPLKARFSQASICWLCEPANRSVLDPQPLVDEVLVFPRTTLSQAAAAMRWHQAVAALRLVVATLRARRFDLVIDAQGTYKSGLLGRLTGAPTRIGFARGAAKEYLPGAATHRVAPPPGPRSRVEKALCLLEPLGADAGLAAAGLPVDREAAAEAERLWSAAGRCPRVLMSPGASARQVYKRWPTDRFGQLAAALAQDGACVRIAWGPGESPLADATATASGLPDLALPATTLPLLSELLRGADLFIGNDSGPMHLAWLVGTRVVALYGPTDPVVNAPWGAGHVRVAVPADERRGRERDPTLMDCIPVAEVLEAVRGVLFR
jgi:ADP-heptose:LPS heptosyltransferase